MSFLALDVGNTRLKWVLFDAPHPGAGMIAQGAEFLEQIDSLAEGAWSQLESPKSILGVSVTSDPIRKRLASQLEFWDAIPQWIHASDQLAGVINGYDQPIRLGADRWVAMIGARTLMARSEGAKAAVVVMVGTAVTVDALTKEGRFLGGFILPGHGMMLKALESGTAGLRVPTGEVVAFPTNTSDALTSGGTFAIAGAVERMMRHLQQHTGDAPVCIMAGGAAWKMQPYLGFDVIRHDNLIFEGLLQIASDRQ